MDKPIIFYGAGSSAKEVLEQCFSKNIVPVCFTDSDKRKHNSSFEAVGGSFEILPLNDALERWPDADVLISTNPVWYAEVRELLLSNGLSEERVRFPDSLKFFVGIPKHCPEIGHFFVLDGLGYKTCCGPYIRNCASTGNLEEDIAQYYEFCEQLRDALNEGKLTSCADCSMLRDGRSEEPLKIERVNLSTGLPGGDRCNARCCYCTYGESLGAHAREDNLLEIVRKLTAQPDMDYLYYASGELSISPYRDEILKMWKEKGWAGQIDTNAFLYCDGITTLLRDRRVRAEISLDAGTPETFTKVKGVDCLGRVMRNIKRYAEAGEVWLKYIILEGINDNDTDIDGFVTIAKKMYVRHIVISRDRRVMYAPMTDNESSAFARLVNQCQTARLPYSFSNGEI
ncbi:radical SAM protein [Synergistaceae bacterium OttesenSCG-928-I11]|nr:radical SAM protein [Synergistaceae bacterium OttesenSCG-928-I11]